MLGHLAWLSSGTLGLGGCGGLVEYADEGGSGSSGESGSTDETDSTSSGSGDGEVASTGDADLGDEDSGSDDEDADIVDCSGAFGAEQVLFEDPGWMPQALSPTADGLEFFYARSALDRSLDDSGERHIALRRRNSVEEPFGEPQLPEGMHALCGLIAPGTELSALDVSGDGLRLYIGCNSFSDPSYPEGPLLVATRPDRRSGFSVQIMPVGAIGFSLGLSRDELTAYGTSRNPARAAVQMYQRSSLEEQFGPAQPTPGSPVLRNPEPAPGGLFLLGVSDRGAVSSRLVSTERSEVGSPFGPLRSEGLPQPPVGAADYSPALGVDCRTLYFTRRQFSSPSAQVMMATR